jgi:ATP-dependent RNA helicase MSS116
MAIIFYYCLLFGLWRHRILCFLLWFHIFFASLRRAGPMLKNILLMSSSISRGGRGAGRAVRKHNSRPYHASTTRNAPATAAKPAVKPAAATAFVSTPVLDDRQRHFSDQTFADAPISQASKAGIKHKNLSDVQAATLSLGLAGKDLLVQAKTGTGKTMAFLLPTVERLAKMSERPQDGQISALILSPTRELALQVRIESKIKISRLVLILFVCQIEEEAKTLLAFHPFKVQHAVGGTKYVHFHL